MGISRFLRRYLSRSFQPTSDRLSEVERGGLDECRMVMVDISFFGLESFVGCVVLLCFDLLASLLRERGFACVALLCFSLLRFRIIIRLLRSLMASRIRCFTDCLCIAVCYMSFVWMLLDYNFRIIILFGWHSMVACFSIFSKCCLVPCYERDTIKAVAYYCR